MPTSYFRSVAAAAAVGVATLTFLAGPAGAQDPCYPPTEGCVSPSSVVATTTSTTAPGPVVAGDTTTTGTDSTSNLARTGFYAIPAAVIGVGLVAGGLALKRSAKRNGASAAR